MTTPSPANHLKHQHLFESNWIPHAVIGAAINGMPPIRAWREYVQLTQAEVATRLGVPLAVYAQQENCTTLTPAMLKHIAAALGITEAQLDFF